MALLKTSLDDQVGVGGFVKRADRAKPGQDADPQIFRISFIYFTIFAGVEHHILVVEILIDPLSDLTGRG